MELKTILIVDDNAINRKILANILEKEYTVLEAENGRVTLDLLNEHANEIAAIVLDLVMPVMDGYGVLKAMQKQEQYKNLPVLVTTGNSGIETEIKALKLGAWDFISKPYNPEIIMFRLKNAIDRSQLSSYKELKYLAEYDSLTGIYNKAKFFEVTRTMIDTNPDTTFAFMRFDVDRFQLINTFFGNAEGDNLLIYITQEMARDAKLCTKATYGRIESDIVGFCVPYNKEILEEMVRQSKQTLAKFNPNYDVVPSVGIVVVDDPTISVEEMYNRATLAAKTCKGNYIKFFAYYDESMSAKIALEQEITNEMNFALENGQFEIYLQPQYNIHTNLPNGAEALVRWFHPKKGMLSPDSFIPVFERNGFITKLDYYVWERACICLHRWMSEGMKPYPISVNVSRVDLYNPKLVETLIELVERYEIEPKYLKLELTESAYTDNPIAMKKMMSELQSKGFVILMDDFGSGYSSLSLLKDIAIDVLKIDMRFLSGNRESGRGDNIIASIIRMAKWLNIPVIAEGAENSEQVELLRSVGCDYVQGFYFAKPMSVSKYEKTILNPMLQGNLLSGKKNKSYHFDDLFSFSDETKMMFNNSLQACAIYEFMDNKIEVIRVNEAYYALLGHDDILSKNNDFIDLIEEDYRSVLLDAFYSCIRTKEDVECDYLRKRSMGEPLWIHTKLHYISNVGNKHIITAQLSDITMRKELNNEFQKYRESILANTSGTHSVLIVDDAIINREILKKILHDKFNFYDAENGEEAIQVLHEHQNEIDLILLDISMPIMDGKAFLKYKKNRPELDGIPVIMITADDSREQQVATFALGANDYIVKPFIPEVVNRRVKNVIESNYRFKEMVKEYNNMSEQVKTDLMTGLINRISMENMVRQRLLEATTNSVMVMLDIDNFKKINDYNGHDYGDKVICEVANKLRLIFRQEDLIARMGGDEFAIFVENITDVKSIEKKVRKLCESMLTIKVKNNETQITCSAGIASTSEFVHSFDVLYQHADKALYNAKCKGRNTTSIYGEEIEEVLISQDFNEIECILNAIDDYIYACKQGTYELLYANENICKLAGMTLYNYKGKKCYEMIMHRKTPCEFCTLSKAKLEKNEAQVIHLPNVSNVFLLRGKDSLRNNIALHIGTMMDISEVNEVAITKEVKKHDKAR
ncbi:MAG: EAL domain-containing protein [Longicatena sp.]